MIVNNLGRIILLFLFPIFLYGEITFDIKLSKEKVYINETIKAELILRYTDDEGIEQNYFEEFITDDFWVKKLEHKKAQKIDNATVRVFEYLLEPKAEGLFKLSPQFVEVTSKKIRAHFKKWDKIYTSEQIIEVFPLHNDLTIQGKYTISAEVDKTKLKANEPLNLTLKIKGSGNIQDIEKFDLGFKERIVYTDTPTIISNFKGSSYEGEFIQKFSIIADKSFSIPSIKFKYFNIETKEEEIISTKPIFIDVEIKEEDSGDHYFLKYIFLLIGLILGLVFNYLFKYVRSNFFKEDSPIGIKIKKAKNDKELYGILLPFSKNSELDSLMQELEENIYHGKKNRLNKKDIIALVESLLEEEIN